MPEYKSIYFCMRKERIYLEKPVKIYYFMSIHKYMYFQEYIRKNESINIDINVF